MESDFSIAQAALQEAMQWIRSQEPPQAAASKGSLRDLVTEHDRILEAMITEKLKQTPFPVLGEEDQQNAKLAHDQKFWAVDPIDGTVNYFHRIPYYSVSIGLVQWLDQHPQFHWGAVATPASGEFFSSSQAIRCEAASLDQSLCAMGFPNQETDPDRRNLMYGCFSYLNENSRGCLRTGSAAANLAYVAASRLQVVVGFGNQIWDIAGGCAIALASGAEVWIHCSGEIRDRMDYVVGSPPAIRPVLGYLAGQGKVFKPAFLR